MSLKTLVFSDIHGQQKGLSFVRSRVAEHVPQLVVVAGDATDHEDPAASLDILNGLGVEVFLVPGNMDRFGTVEDYDNIYNLHGSREERSGVGFVGFGAVHMGDLDLTEFLRPMVKPGDVIVSHFPSKGFNDLTHSGHNAGSSRIARAVRELGFRLHISGHIHESPGVVQEDGIHYINPGPAYEERGLLVEIGDEILIKKL